MTLAKTLVLGSTGHAHVVSVDWGDVGSVNLVDFDLVVVNTHSLTDDFLKSQKWDFFDPIRKGLSRLLASGGRIVALGTLNRRVNVAKDTYRDPYSWSPIDIGTASESGDTVKIQAPNSFPKLLSKITRWDFWYFIPNGCLSRELTDICGSTYEYEYSNGLQALAENRYGKMLAGVITFSIRRKDGASKVKERTLGPLTVLPSVEQLDQRQAVNLVLEDLLFLPQEFLPPKWVEQVPMPLVDGIVTQIEQKTSQVQDLEAGIEILKHKKADIEKFKELLFTSGHQLEEIFAKCLEILGGKVSPARYSQEEFILDFEGVTCLVECKGISKSVSLTHLRQLTDYMLRYEEDEGRSGKGILFGNAWRDLPLSDRGLSETPLFPENVIVRAESLQVALVSSTAFFAVLCRLLDGEIQGGEVIRRMLTTVGVVEFC